jgi:diaminopimelate decarboxylase
LKENKFGISIDTAIEAYKVAKDLPAINVIGVDCHIGSQLTEVAPFLDALTRVLALVDALDAEGIHIRHLDLGGGLGVRYNNETPPEPAEYVSQVIRQLGDRKIELVMEPGRSISANAGVLLTRVEYIKPTPHKNFAIIDAAMNDLLRPSLYGAWQKIVSVNNDSSEPEQIYDLVGPVCETGDFLGKDRPLRIKAGDLLAVKSAGAYGFSMSSNYNSRNRAAEVLVDGDKTHLVRARETFAYQMALEKALV